MRNRATKLILVLGMIFFYFFPFQALADSIELENTLYYPNSLSVQVLGSTSSQTYRAQAITFASTTTLKSVRLGLMKTGTPTDNLTVDIVADNSGSPASTPLSTASIAGSSLTTSVVSYRFDLNVPATFNAGVQYWLRVGRSGSTNSSNFYRIMYNDDGTDIYSTGLFKVYNGSSWSTVSGDMSVFYYQDYELPSGGGGSFLTPGGVGTAQAAELEMTVNEDGDVASIGLTHDGWMLVNQIFAVIVFIVAFAVMLFAIAFFYKKARYK